MKKIVCLFSFLVSFFVISSLFVSCSKDEYDEIDPKNVVGVWQAVKVVRVIGDSKVMDDERKWLRTYGDMLHFYDDGRLVHYSSDLGENNSTLRYTYRVEGKTILVDITGNSAARTETMEGYMKGSTLIVKRTIKTQKEFIEDTFTFQKY